MRLTRRDLSYLQSAIAGETMNYLGHHTQGHLRPDEVKHLDYLRGLNDRLDLAQGRHRPRVLGPDDYQIVLVGLPLEQGGGFVGTVPDLPGCMGDGPTPETATADARAAIGEWLDEVRRLQREIPPPRNKPDKEATSAHDTTAPT